MIQRWVLALVPRVMALAVRALARTWRVRLDAAPGTLPYETDGPVIYAMWHEGVLTVTANWRDHSIQGLASQSFDGALISQTMVHLGFPVNSRGSSSRGGAGALRSHLQALQLGRHVVVTLDGPRGPAHEPKAGAAVMAARSGRPIVPVACAVDPRWRLRSWDRTQVPPPFARVAYVLKPAVFVANGGENEGLRQLKIAMDEAQKDAEALLARR